MFPLPNKELLFIVFIFVPLINVSCLPVKSILAILFVTTDVPFTFTSSTLPPAVELITLFSIVILLPAVYCITPSLPACP